MDKNDKWTKSYIGIIVAIYILLAIISFKLPFIYQLNFKNSTNELIIYSLILGISITIADLYPITYFPNKKNQAEITISLALTLSMAFILPPIYTILTKTFANTLAGILKRKKDFLVQWYKVLFNTAYLSIVAGLTSITFHVLYQQSLPFTSVTNIIALIAGGTVYFFLETTILFVLLAHLNEVPFHEFWAKNIKAAGLELLTLFPLGYLIIFIYIKNFWIEILLIPLFIAIYLASQEKIDIIKQTEDTLYALAKLEDDKFPDTMAHSERSGNLAALLCEKLGKTGKEREIIFKAARLHDIGKISIPDAIINKKDRLTEEEFIKIKEHPIKGADLVKHLVSFQDGAKYILYHHERWDGKGYPEGLKETNIPIGSRIICVVDSFDAMISNRPYKKAKTIKEALLEIKKESGRQFDPEIAKVFIKMVEELINDDKVVKSKEQFEKYFPKDAKIGK